MKDRLFIQLHKHPLRTFFIVSTILYFFFLWKDMLVIRPDGLYAGHPYVWADWSLHIGLASIFAYKPVSLWFDAYPIYAGAKLTYPFLSNLLSGLFMRFGTSIPFAFIVPSFICSIISVFLLYRFFSRFLPTDRQRIGAMMLFLCSGGLGAFLLTQTKGIATVLFDASLVTTQIPDLAIETNNILSSMIIPQRAFLLGLPIGLYILSTIYSLFLDRQKKVLSTHNRLQLIVAGVLAGILPISHTHTFLLIVLFSCYAFTLSIKQIKRWLWYGIPAVGVSALIYSCFLFGNVNTSSFFTLHPGWMAGPHVGVWVLFWLRNWGIFLLLALFGTCVLYRQQKWPLLSLTLFFWGVFLLANVIQFQPQLWDNTKLFAWCYLGLTGSAISCLMFVWKKKLLLFRGIAIVLFFLSIFSGAIDVVHNLDRERKTFRMLSTQEIEMGEWVRDHTSPQSVILTREIVTNPIVMLSGRSTLVGYSGWMFNFGLPYVERLSDIDLMYQNPTAQRSLVEKYKVNFILITRDKESETPQSSLSQFTKVYGNDYADLYQVR